MGGDVELQKGTKTTKPKNLKEVKEKEEGGDARGGGAFKSSGSACSGYPLFVTYNPKITLLKEAVIIGREELGSQQNRDFAHHSRF